MLSIQRILIALTILVCLIPVAGYTQPAGQNLLQDPGFDNAIIADKAPTVGWYRNYGDANSQVTVEAESGHDGGACARIAAPTIPVQDPALSIEQVVPVIPGKAFLFTAWVRAESEGAKGMLVIVWQGEGGRWINAISREFNYTTDWQMQSVYATAPEGAVAGVARLDIRSPGVAWMDDASFAERLVAHLEGSSKDAPAVAGATVALTWRALAADGQPVSGSPAEVQLVTNGDARLLPETLEEDTYRTDDKGILHVTMRVSSEPGSVDLLTISSGNATLKLHLTASTQGQPTSYTVTPEHFAPAPGELFPVRVSLVGAFGEALPLSDRSVQVGDVTGITDARGELLVQVRAPEQLFGSMTITARDDAGIIGTSLPVVASPPIRRNLIRVSPNGYFINPAGSPLIPLGGLYANRVHIVEDGDAVGTISEDFTDATDEQLHQWFAYLKANGVTALRGMLRNHTKLGTEPMDIVGRVNESLLRSWEHQMEVAREYGIGYIVTLHESWYATYAAYYDVGTLERCVLPKYEPTELETLPAYRRRFLVEKRMLKQITEPFTDPDILQCQRDYLTELIPRLRGNPDIIAYEIENEQPNGFYNWTNDQISLIRRYDPLTPISVSHLGGGLINADPIPWATRTGIDFYTYHIYPSGGTTPDRDYGTVVALTSRYCALGKPTFSGESFGDEWFNATPAARHLGARDLIWAQLLGRNIGAFVWDTVDEPIKEFRLAHQLAERIGFGSFRLAHARLGVDVSPVPTDDVNFSYLPGNAKYEAMGRITQACFRHGVDFEFTFTPDAFPEHIAVTDLDAVAQLTPEIALPDGYEVQYLRSDDNKRFLCYLRNVAGGSVTITGQPAQGWTRSRLEVPLTFRILLPIAASELTIVDLDTGEEQTIAFRQGESINLGQTDHDFAIITAG